MDVPARQELAVSLFLPVATGPATFHLTSRETSFVGAGDQSANGEFTVTTTRECWWFLAGIDVETDHAAGTVIALGDSITDGNETTLGLNRRWPASLSWISASSSPDPTPPCG